MDEATPTDAQTPSADAAATGSLQVRLLREQDADLLGDYLESLSEATRSFWAPHAFTREAAREICAGLATDPALRFIAHPTDSHGPIAAYFLLHRGARPSDSQRYAALGLPLNDATDAALAPSVADAYQNRGVGGIMMRQVLQTARSLGYRRIVLWDGVQARNARGVRFYTRWGFRKVGEFTNSLLNYDMMLELGA